MAKKRVKIEKKLPCRYRQGRGWWWRENRTRCIRQWRRHTEEPQVLRSIWQLKSPCLVLEVTISNKAPTSLSLSSDFSPFLFLSPQFVKWINLFFFDREDKERNGRDPVKRLRDRSDCCYFFYFFFYANVRFWLYNNPPVAGRCAD